MPNPRIASLRAARHTTAGLKALFGQMGSTQHPRGRILRAYRNVRRGAASAFREPSPQYALREVLQGFRLEMSAHINGFLIDARSLGAQQARVDIEAWGLSQSGSLPRTLGPERTAWLGIVDTQIAATEASPTPEYVLGGESQLGVLQPAPTIQAGAHWLSSTATLFWFFGIQQPVRADNREWDWFKQAIPAIDMRTTDCCLRVAGQAVPLSEQFRLTGKPRYADNQEWSPFHDWCRTSVALVPKHLADDDLAQQLRNDAQRWIIARHNARVEAGGIIQELIDLGTPGNSRARKDDTAEITRLRRELLGLRELAGYDLGDS